MSEQKKQNKQTEKQTAEDEQTEAATIETPQADAAADLLDEIDEVLEENAQAFVEGFVQKGGE